MNWIETNSVGTEITYTHVPDNGVRAVWRPYPNRHRRQKFLYGDNALDELRVYCKNKGA